jgi:carbon monoxide dehydrogenase subunit G
VSADVVAGRLRLKVGAGTVTYRGTATIADADPAEGTLDIAIDVAQARGNGALAGYLRVALTPTGSGTLVSVVPELEVSGRAAEFKPEDLRDAVGALAGAWVAALAGGLAGAEAVEAEAETQPEPAAETEADAEPERQPEAETQPEVEEAAAQPEPEPEPEAAVAEPAESAPVSEVESEVAARIESVVTEPETAVAEPGESQSDKPAPLLDDSLSGDPLDVVWRGEYEKNPWIPLVAVLAFLLFLRRRSRKHRPMS